jgi:glycosyltransferase involved in cell wall biosynthesis
MVASIQQLLADKELQNLLKKNARKLVELKFSWDGIASKIEDHFEKI